MQIKKINVKSIVNCLAEKVEKEKTHKEYEQCWELNSLPDDVKDPSKIKQAFIFKKDKFNLRIREEIPKGEDPIYTMTCKYTSKSDESEVVITKDMFEYLWNEIIPDTKMIKTRWRLGNWEIDEKHEPEYGVFAEIETNTKDEKVEVPDDFDIKKKIK